MPKRTIEINDSLQECVDSAVEQVKEELISYLDQNPNTDETPDLGNDLDYSGAIHEIVDGSVPIYTSEQNDIWYLYGNECETLFEDQFGAEAKTDGPGWPMGWKAAAIYCYIDDKVRQWYNDNADDVFEEWKEKQPQPVDECDTCEKPATCEKCHSCADCCAKYDCQTVETSAA